MFSGVIFCNLLISSLIQQAAGSSAYGAFAGRLSGSRLNPQAGGCGDHVPDERQREDRLIPLEIEQGLAVPGCGDYIYPRTGGDDESR